MRPSRDQPVGHFDVGPSTITSVGPPPIGMVTIPRPRSISASRSPDGVSTGCEKRPSAVSLVAPPLCKVVSPHVLHRAGQPIKSFRVAFRTACVEAGCPGRVLHDFRRTAVRNLVRAGIPERVAMQLTGHKTRSVFERYNIVSAGDLREAAKRLDAVTGTISGTIDQNQPGRSKT